MKIELTPDEAWALLKLAKIGLNKVRGQQYVQGRYGGRMDNSNFFPLAQHAVTLFTAQVALDRRD
jgi:hypothetical protein